MSKQRARAGIRLLRAHSLLLKCDSDEFELAASQSRASYSMTSQLSLAHVHAHVVATEPRVCKISTGEAARRLCTQALPVGTCRRAPSHAQRVSRVALRRQRRLPDRPAPDTARAQSLPSLVVTFMQCLWLAREPGCIWDRRAHGGSLQLEEHSLDVDLRANQLAVQFSDSAIVLGGVDARVHNDHVVLLIATVNAVYRFTLRHPVSVAKVNSLTLLFHDRSDASVILYAQDAPQDANQSVLSQLPRVIAEMTTRDFAQVAEHSSGLLPTVAACHLDEHMTVPGRLHNYCNYACIDHKCRRTLHSATTMAPCS